MVFSTYGLIVVLPVKKLSLLLLSFVLLPLACEDLSHRFSHLCLNYIILIRKIYVYINILVRILFFSNYLQYFGFSPLFV